MKNSKGITLIALIITIIVLLILAGVTLNMLMGDNGIIAKAQLAKEKTKDSQIKENIILSDYENKLNEYIDGNREQINNLDGLYDAAKTFFENYKITWNSESSKKYNTGANTVTNFDKIVATETITEEEHKADYLYLIGSNYDIYVYGNKDPIIYILYNGVRYDILLNGVYKNQQIIPLVDGVNTYEVHCGWKDYHSSAYVSLNITKKYISEYTEDKDLYSYIKFINQKLNF